MSDLATAGHLRQSTTQFPPSWYCDPRVFEAEQRQLLARAPGYVGHELTQFCQAVLTDAQQQIEILERGMLKPFAPGGGDDAT